MIFDHIDHAECYARLSPALREAFRFLGEAYAAARQGRFADPGRYELAHGVFVNADRYTTLQANPNGMEAHRRYIDVQLLLRGSERVRVEEAGRLTLRRPYDPQRDAAFFAPSEEATEVRLGNGAFVLLLPHDAHEPQLCDGVPAEVLKLVAKVPAQSV